MSLLDTKTLQFELWQECNNHCTFCYLNDGNRFTPDEIKIKSLHNVIEKVSDKSVLKNFNCIGLIGGEFFQGQLKNPEVKSLFYSLIDKISNLYNSNEINEVWITATLTIGKQEDLYEILKKFNNHRRVWISTSWDSIGRFKSEKMKNNWEFHIHHLKEVYPELKFNTTMILTGDLIDKYLSGEFGTFESFCECNQTSLFFKQCGPLVKCHVNTLEDSRKSKIDSNLVLQNFFPTRSKFIQFLTKFKNQETADMWSRLFNIQYRADDLIRTFNDGHSLTSIRTKNSAFEVAEDVHMKCGHPITYAAYIDSDKCCLCDKIRISQI